MDIFTDPIRKRAVELSYKTPLSQDEFNEFMILIRQWREKDKNLSW